MGEANKNAEAQSPFRFQVEEPELWKRIVKVEVGREHFEKEYARRLRAAAKQHVRAGFRKGKTPKAIVEREMGPQLRGEALEHIVPQAFKAAIVEHELVPLTDPNVENLVFDADKPLTFDLIIEIRPKITAHDYDDLPLRRRQPSVSDEEVDEVVSRMQESRAEYRAVERSAISGDRVVLDLERLGDDGQPLPDGRVEGQQLQLGDENNFPAFESAIVGACANDVRRIDVSYPDNHHSEELRGRTVSFQALVKEVQEKILPEIDDAFAASFQEGQTLLEMRAAIRADLLKEEEARTDRELEEQIVDALIARNDVSVPPSLIEQYLKSSLEELHGRNMQLGRSNSPEEDERYREMTRPVAERILKGMFIMEAIRRQESIQVEEAEVAGRIEEIAAQYKFDVEKYREYAQQGSERDRIVHGLEERKTFDFLLSRAKIDNAAEAAAD